ncbi:HEL094Cp [Eremothecium sinecaudum]|uniref:HEL094Cp n=1 Tax=Eremothecium sinecaudum TaxID=45286 RepID=A0A0X8HTI6_9SACH|nr:HEL094Cp [Eremothecium sinecaudum]AMD21186.1 HEL094Cp [Eremothecium sinecaudum]
MLTRALGIQRRALVRTIANIPDNSPRASENERWLSDLGTLAGGSIETEPIANSIEELDTYKLQGPDGGLYEVVSTPPDSKYIVVKSLLSNFTSVAYLQANKNRRVQQSNFVDLRIVKCKSGSGGNGVVSFFRDAGRSIGPPDGGDGGDGGSIYVQAVPGINTLTKMKTTYIAEDGANGGADQFDGAKGKDLLISVPIGTVIKWSLHPKVVRKFLQDTMAREPGSSIRSILNKNAVKIPCVGAAKMAITPKAIQLFRNSYKVGQGWIFKEKDEKYHLEKDWFQALNKKVSNYDREIMRNELADDTFPLFGLDLDKATTTPIRLLSGGKGGLGNMHFLTNLIRNPRFAKLGRAGIEQYFLFELKSLADLGLVGFPNAGKSTILNKISNATPKVGHWEFTTLNPTIGTINMGIDKPSFTVADIPGIIDDASNDKGMGLEFIRHIERSKGLVFVLSLEDLNPIDKLKTLVKELGGLDKVSEKNVLVVCNKADIDYEKPESFQKYLIVQQFCKSQNWDIIPISALKGENIDLLINKMAKCAGKLPV